MSGRGRGQPRGRGRGQARGPPSGRSSVSEVSTAMASLSTSTSSKQGQLGERVLLKTNYASLSKLPDMRLYQYRVDFSLDEDRTFVKKAIVRRIKNTLPTHVFDGTVMYSLEPLYAHAQAASRTELGVRLHEGSDKAKEEGEKCEITIKLVGEVAPSDPHYVSFLNVLLKRTMDRLEMQQVGRNIYDVKATIPIPSAKIELWPGYVTALRHHEDDFLVCVDVDFKVVRQSTVLEALNQLGRGGASQDSMKKGLIGCIVITRYNNKTYRVDDINFDNNPNYSFEDGKTGMKVTLRDYYKQKYGLEIRNKTQPLLVSMPKERDVRGGRTEPYLLIPELCNLTGMDENMRSNYKLMNELATVTRPDPVSRLNRIRKFIERLRTNSSAMSTLEEWNLSLKGDVEEVYGRMLPMEKLYFGGQKPFTCTPESVEFTRQLNQGMAYPKAIARWVCIYPERDGEKAYSFLMALKKEAGILGVEMREPKSFTVSDTRVGSYTRKLREVIDMKPNMVMVMIPNEKSDAYAAVKKEVCINNPIPSQVVTFSKVINKDSNKHSAMAKKIILQMATKLGGCPWRADNPLKSAMYVGFDTYHDTMDRKKSVGALVATMDAELSRYFCDVVVHESQEEMSDQMSILIFNAVKKYFSIHNKAPKQIFMYRDGVGDGQLDMVKKIEVQQTLKMLEEFKIDNNLPEVPKLVYTIVSKRINTRFFRQLNQKVVNPCSGTVVDSVVTLPERYDFFIVSPSVRQGTVSPTGYNIIHSDVGLSTDKHQLLAYKWTHIYFNWAGTVKVPGICQNAHKLAKLVGENLHDRFHPQLQETLFFL